MTASTAKTGAKSRIGSRRSEIGFTLIELLVVVTIIVVLLALLVPAMDKAIYQAEMMICGTNQRGIVTGVTSYAMENKRYYPKRHTLETTAQFRRYNILSFKTHINSEPVSDEFANDYTKLRPYVQLKLLLDPLNGGITTDDIERSLPTTNIFTNYAMWWDWKYTSANGGSGSTKIGQTFNWLDSRFDVLVSEEDLLNVNSGTTHGSHPDELGFQSLEVLVDSPALASDTETLSRWRGPGSNPPRSPIDANYGFQDGSVSRIDAVTYRDPRLIRASDKVDRANNAEIYVQLPEKGRR